MSHALPRCGTAKAHLPCTQTVAGMFANLMETGVMLLEMRITLVIMATPIQTFVVPPVQILQLSSGLGDSKDEFPEDS